MQAGCYPADEELEDFIFADSTQSALFTFQVACIPMASLCSRISAVFLSCHEPMCNISADTLPSRCNKSTSVLRTMCEPYWQAINGLDETGIADMPTWTALLGPQLVPVSGSPASGSTATAQHTSAPSAAPQQAREAPAWDGLFAADANGAYKQSANGSIGSPSAAAAPAGQRSNHAAPPKQPAASAGPPPSKWPVVRMDDGGREVHWLQVRMLHGHSECCVFFVCRDTVAYLHLSRNPTLCLHVSLASNVCISNSPQCIGRQRLLSLLQCALEVVGCYCGEDDMMWWQFGTATESALRTFQARDATPANNCMQRLRNLSSHAAPAAGAHVLLVNPSNLPLQGMNGLPETGVSDAATWQTLLGEGAQPADLLDLHAKNAQYDDDMAGHNDSVWLLVRIWLQVLLSSIDMHIVAPTCCQLLAAAFTLCNAVTFPRIRPDANHLCTE